MKITFTLPQLGLTQTEGAVSEWLRKTGDTVKKDEPVFIVSTDKADMEIEAPADGIMGEILIETGLTVTVGTPLGYLIVEGDEPDTKEIRSLIEADLPEVTSAERSIRSAPSKVAKTDQGADYIASPRAKRLAREVGVDLSTLQGTGPAGRILEADVRAAMTPATKASSVATPAAPSSHAVPPLGDARRRLLIADRMTESIRTIPAFSVSLEVNCAKLVDLYESVSAQFANSAKLSYTDLLLKGVAIALKDTPLLNARWVENGPELSDGIHLNLAVATDRGVAAPVIRNVDQLSLVQLANARADLTEKSRKGRLSLAEVENGAGTLSNLGMFRVDRFEGIITPGQSFIVSLGRISRRSWIEGETISIQPTLHLTVTVDHRIVDGAQAAAFLGRIADTIERPYILLWGQR